MTGDELKQKLIQGGKTLTAVAKDLNMTQPNFSTALTVKDVKSGLIEKLCDCLNVKLDFFYGDTHYLPEPKAIDSQRSDFNNGNTSRSLEKLLSMLDKKDDEFWKLKDNYEGKIEKLEATINSQRKEYYDQLKIKDDLINSLYKEISELKKKG
jgi:hypothetical protein